MPTKYVVTYNKPHQSNQHEDNLKMDNQESLWQGLPKEYEKRNLELKSKREEIRSRIQNTRGLAPRPLFGHMDTNMNQHGSAMHGTLHGACPSTPDAIYFNNYQYPNVGLGNAGKQRYMGPDLIDKHVAQEADTKLGIIKQYMKQLELALNQKLEEERLKPESSRNESVEEFSYIKQSVNDLLSKLGCSSKNGREFTKTRKGVQELETLSMQGAMGDYSQIGQGFGEAPDESLNGIARQLSRTLLEMQTCHKCKKVPEDAIHTVNSIKNLLDLLNKMSLKKEERHDDRLPSSEPQHSRAPLVEPKGKPTQSPKNVTDAKVQTKKKSVSIGVGTDAPVSVATETDTFANLLTEQISQKLGKQLSKHLIKLSVSKVLSEDDMDIRKESREQPSQQSNKSTVLTERNKKEESELHLKTNLYVEEDAEVNITFILDQSGTLREVLTEGPDGTIDSTVTYTDSGNIAVATEVTTFLEDGYSTVLIDGSTKSETLISSLSRPPASAASSMGGSSSSSSRESLCEEIQVPIPPERKESNEVIETCSKNELKVDPEYPKEGGDGLGSSYTNMVAETEAPNSLADVEGEHGFAKKEEAPDSPNFPQPSMDQRQVLGATLPSIIEEDEDSKQEAIDVKSTKQISFTVTESNEEIPKAIEELITSSVTEMVVGKASFERTPVDTEVTEEKASALKELVIEDELDSIAQEKDEISESLSMDATTGEEISILQQTSTDDELTSADVVTEEAIATDMSVEKEDALPVTETMTDERNETSTENSSFLLDTIPEETALDLIASPTSPIKYWLSMFNENKTPDIPRRSFDGYHRVEYQNGTKAENCSTRHSAEALSVYDSEGSSTKGSSAREEVKLTAELTVALAITSEKDNKGTKSPGSKITQIVEKDEPASSILDSSAEEELNKEIIGAFEKANRDVMEALDQANRNIAEVLEQANLNVNFAIDLAVKETGQGEKDSMIAPHEVKGVANLSDDEKAMILPHEVKGSPNLRIGEEPPKALKESPVKILSKPITGKQPTKNLQTVRKDGTAPRNRRASNEKPRSAPGPSGSSRATSLRISKSELRPCEDMKVKALPASLEPSTPIRLRRNSNTVEMPKQTSKAASSSMPNVYSAKGSLSNSGRKSSSKYAGQAPNEGQLGKQSSTRSDLHSTRKSSNKLENQALKGAYKRPGNLSPQAEERFLRKLPTKSKEEPGKNAPIRSKGQSTEEKVPPDKRPSVMPKSKSWQEEPYSDEAPCVRTKSLLLPGKKLSAKPKHKLVHQVHSPRLKSRSKLLREGRPAKKSFMRTKSKLIKEETSTKSRQQEKHPDKKTSIRSKSKQEGDLDKKPTKSSQEDVHPVKKPPIKSGSQSVAISEPSIKSVLEEICSDEELSMISQCHSLPEEHMVREPPVQAQSGSQSVQEVNAPKKSSAGARIELLQKIYCAKESFIKSANQTLKEAAELVGKLAAESGRQTPQEQAYLKEINTARQLLAESIKFPIKHSRLSSRIKAQEVGSLEELHEESPRKLSGILEQAEESDSANSKQVTKTLEKAPKGSCQELKKRAEYFHISDHYPEFRISLQPGPTKDQEELHTINLDEEIGEESRIALNADEDVLDVVEETQKRKKEWAEKHARCGSEKRKAQNNLLDQTPGGQTVSFQNTISDLQTKLSALHSQCRQKDHVIATMLQALQLKSKSDFDEIEVRNSLSSATSDSQCGLIDQELKENVRTHWNYPCPSAVENRKSYLLGAKKHGATKRSPSVFERLSSPPTRKLSKAWALTRIHSPDRKTEAHDQERLFRARHKNLLKPEEKTPSIPVICLPFPIRPEKSYTCQRIFTPICVLDSNDIKFPASNYQFPHNYQDSPVPVGDSPPLKITEVRKIASGSLIVRWTPPLIKNLTGYEVLVDGIIKSRVCNAKTTSVVLNKLALGETVSIAIYGITPTGRYQPPTKAIFRCT